jgi:hypothetical protein
MANPIRFTAGNTDFTPLPEGTYDCKILSFEQTTSSTGNPQLAIKLEIVDGPLKQRQPMVWYSLTPKAGWKMKKLLEELAINYADQGVDDDGFAQLEFDPDDLVGRVVRYDVTQREYNNRKNNQFGNETVSEWDPHFAEIKAMADGVSAEGPAAPVVQEPPVQQAAPAAAAARRRPQPALRR